VPCVFGVCVWCGVVCGMWCGVLCGVFVVWCGVSCVGGEG